MQRIESGKVKEKRNTLAHGGAITKDMAQALREIVIGDRNTPGVLCWLAEHLDAAEVAHQQSSASEAFSHRLLLLKP